MKLFSLEVCFYQKAVFVPKNYLKRAQEICMIFNKFSGLQIDNMWSILISLEKIPNYLQLSEKKWSSWYLQRQKYIFQGGFSTLYKSSLSTWRNSDIQNQIFQIKSNNLLKLKQYVYTIDHDYNKYSSAPNNRPTLIIDPAGQIAKS